MMNIRQTGGYINKKGNLMEFIPLQCETCDTIGCMQGTITKIPHDKGVHMMFKERPPSIFYKETKEGVKYEPLCGPCSTRISLVQVDKAVPEDKS